MNTSSLSFILALTFFLNLGTSAQTARSTNYFASIKNYDLSKLWRSDSIQAEGDGDMLPFPEPLGYIGENYQRFYIHYLKVVKTKGNPYLYKVSGKTRVKNNICNFTGTITVKKAFLYKESDITGYRQGSVICQVIFYEDSTQQSSGIIKGTLTSDFYLDKNGKLQYDALMFVADNYYNNQCKATWKSYRTGKSKRCNWGDYRMPDSNDLDGGTGDVSIKEKYINNGWQTFVAAFGPENSEKARQIEEAEWWK